MDSLVWRLLFLSVIMYVVLTTDAGKMLDTKTKISVILWVDIIYTLVDRFQYFSVNFKGIFCGMCGASTASSANDEAILDKIAADQRASINNLNA
jgi:hypothetical protein